MNASVREPLEVLDVLGVFRSVDKLGNRIVVVLQGFPCSWGRCSFCPFYLEQSTNLSEIIERNRTIISRAIEICSREPVNRVTVFNGGSFFEMPLAIIEMLRPLTRGRVIDIESRPEFVSLESLQIVDSLLDPRELVVRVGLEVFDESLRNGVLNKGIPQSEVERLARLRSVVRDAGMNVRIVAYVLFGIQGIPEHKVIESVRMFNRMFDGVIAIRYRRYLPHHPEEAPVSNELRELLERECLYVDWGEGEEWIVGSAPLHPSSRLSTL